MVGYKSGIADSWGKKTIGTLPSGIKPKMAVVQLCACENGTSWTTYLSVQLDGSVIIGVGGSEPPGSQPLSCSLPFVIA